MLVVFVCLAVVVKMIVGLDGEKYIYTMKYCTLNFYEAFVVSRFRT